MLNKKQWDLSLSSQNFLIIVVFLQVVMYISLFLNFQPAREVIGIFYLTFLPGIIIVKLLKIKLEPLELILYSAGFSVAFLMLAGLAINQFGPIAGIVFPLSTLPLSLLINTLIIVGAAVVFIRRDKTKQEPTGPNLVMHPLVLLLTLLPILSIVGTSLVNATGNNFFLLLMIVSVALVFTIGAFYKKCSAVYPVAIFMVALALLFQSSLISNYILPYGSDVPGEFYVFRTTQLNSVWNPVFPFPFDQVLGRYNAMLSITVLPTVYSNILGMDPALVFKVIYPLIFALVPIGLYLLWQPYIGKKFAFLATFLFMAQSTFYTEMTALNRQMIAELFFVLLLLLLLNKKLGLQTKFLSFAIFSFALIFSHYALAEVFLFLLFIAWAISTFYLKKSSFNLKSSMIIFFFVAMFSWYIYTSGSVVFDSFVKDAASVTAQLGDFLSPSSRDKPL